MESTWGHGRLGVVFVHGFNSSAEMWEPFTSLIGQDENLDFVRALHFSYDTRLWQLSPLREVPEFDTVAEERSKKLVEAHERFSSLMGTGHFQVAYPVLPMDILGVYVLLPDGAHN